MAATLQTSPRCWFELRPSADGLVPVVDGRRELPPSVDATSCFRILEYALDGRTVDELVGFVRAETAVDPARAEAVVETLHTGGYLVEGGVPAVVERWFERNWHHQLALLSRTRAADPGTGTLSPVRSGDTAAESGDPPGTDDPPGTGVVLPEPTLVPSDSIVEVLSARRSCRDFDGTAIDPEALSFVLDHAARTVRAGRPPSGVVEVYPAVMRMAGIDAGVYRYDPSAHRLLPVPGADGGVGRLDEAVQSIAIDQPYSAGAAVAFLLAADFEAGASAIPGPRGYFELCTMLGAIGQRVAIAATSLGLGTFVTAAIRDSEAAAFVDCDPSETPVLYLLAVGNPVDGFWDDGVALVE